MRITKLEVGYIVGLSVLGALTLQVTVGGFRLDAPTWVLVSIAVYAVFIAESHKHLCRMGYFGEGHFYEGRWSE